MFACYEKVAFDHTLYVSGAGERRNEIEQSVLDERYLDVWRHEKYYEKRGGQSVSYLKH